MRVRGVARVLGLGGTALAVGIAISSGRAKDTDERAFRAVNGVADPRVDRAASAITELGSIWASVGGALVLAAAGRRRAAVKGVAAAGIAWLAGQGLKKLIERPRPYQADVEGTRLLVVPPRASSWPSSHPAVLLAFVDTVGRETGVPPVVRGALTGLAGAVGLSRVVVGVHYPADVAGGLLLGRAVATAVGIDGR